MTPLLAAFAAGYLARPIGAIILGHVGDKIGRKTALTIVISVMGDATVAIGLPPGYATIGVAAPVLLIAMRVLQGFAVAGEYPTSTIFLIEHAPTTGAATSPAGRPSVSFRLAPGIRRRRLGQ